MLPEITLIFGTVPKLKVVPGVTVACQTSDDMILSGRVNVMLPLTKTPATDTGLSVLLNAFFALSQNRGTEEFAVFKNSHSDELFLPDTEFLAACIPEHFFSTKCNLCASS